MNDIYRVLKTLRKYNGREDFTNELISAGKLKMTYEEWEQMMIALQKKGLVDGVVFTQTLSDRFPKIVDMSRVQITLEGIGYLEDNSLMKRAAEMLKMAGEIF